jgi:hypothetical protein
LPEIIELGPFMLRGSLLIILLSAAAGFVHLYIKLRQSSLHKSPIGDLILNGIIIVVISWKLGPLVYEPSMLWKEPIKLLMVSGTVDIALFGGVIAAAYWSVRLRKLGLSWYVMLDALSYLLSAAILVYSLLTLQYGLIVVSLIVILVQWIGNFVISEGSASRLTYSILGVGSLLSSIFIPQTVFIFNLSVLQIAAILIALLGAAITPKGEDWIDESLSTYTTFGKELNDMAANRSGDSIEQQKQKNQNKSPQDNPGIDKKLDGPNRPST